MNSLSMFENEKDPLLAYLGSVSKGHYIAQGVEANTNTESDLEIILPNKKCLITVRGNKVIISRLSEECTHPRERESSYPITCINSAKIHTGIFSGVCYEFGCGSYKDADATVKTIYHQIWLNHQKK